MKFSDIFEYDGVNLRYKLQRGKMKAGSVAGTLNKGYVQIRLDNKTFPAHRIIWEMVNGTIPNDLQIDHINHVRNDNRISNLRLVTIHDNSKNMSMKKSNTSGVMGVYYSEKYLNKWRALIRVNGKRITLGSFSTKQEAITARKNAEIQHGFHQNHGDTK